MLISYNHFSLTFQLYLALYKNSEVKIGLSTNTRIFKKKILRQFKTIDGLTFAVKLNYIRFFLVIIFFLFGKLNNNNLLTFAIFI